MSFFSLIHVGFYALAFGVSLLAGNPILGLLPAFLVSLLLPLEYHVCVSGAAAGVALALTVLGQPPKRQFHACFLSASLQLLIGQLISAEWQLLLIYLWPLTSYVVQRQLRE